VLTCQACPEQYELRDPQGAVVAYLRLRFGRFTVECPDVLGEVVYSHTWEGDEYKGAFDSDAERRHHLAAAVHAAERWHRERLAPPPAPTLDKAMAASLS